MTVPRRTARGLLFDDTARLVLIRRTKPGRAPYWVAPGGGVEPGETAVAALHRELREELGATAVVGDRVLTVAGPVSADEVFLARLGELRPSDRTGAEWTDGDPARGRYEVRRVPVAAVAELNLLPIELRDFVVAQGERLAGAAARLG